MNGKKIAVIIAIVLVIIIVGILGINLYKNIKNQNEIDSSIHGVVIVDETPFYKEAETENVKQIRLLSKAENVYILDEFEQDGVEWYKVKVDGKTNGYVRKENVDYFEEVNKEKVLVSDVSKFNDGTDFESSEEYEVFLIENEISYVYIRAGGRGYGEEGVLYEDSSYQMFVDACEYLGVPYGFYFLDEALDSDEIEEEVEFIEDFLNEHAGKYCVLPVVLDVEKHGGDGRADDIWDTRAELVQELIDELEDEDIECMVYSNAQTANLYLSSLDTMFWISYYPEDEEVPDYWYFDTDQDGASNLELYQKTVGWQFSENGVGDEILTRVDLSLFKIDFYK